MAGLRAAVLPPADSDSVPSMKGSDRCRGWNWGHIARSRSTCCSTHTRSCPDKIAASRRAILPPSAQRLSKTIDELSKMPFELIYHDTVLGTGGEVRKVVFHRNAEVLIPQRLDLRAVRHVLCRSQAEHETLLNLLPLRAPRKRWADKIGVAPQVELVPRQVEFRRASGTGRRTRPVPFQPRPPRRPGHSPRESDISRTVGNRLAKIPMGGRRMQRAQRHTATSV